MAAISRIIALPSATQYNPSPPTFDDISYGGNYLESPTIRVDYETPTDVWKNKPLNTYPSIYYRQIVKRDSDGYILQSEAIGSAAGFVNSVIMTAGTLCNHQAYTISNGSTVYSPLLYFTAQTRPDTPSSITLGSYSYSSIPVSWSDMSPSSRWGGAPSADREWRVILEKYVNPIVGYGQVIIDSTIPGTATSYTFGGFFDGTYRVVLYAKTKAGLSSSFTTTGGFSVSPPGPFFPSFGPYFPYFGGGGGGGIY